MKRQFGAREIQQKKKKSVDSQRHISLTYTQQIPRTY